MFLIFAPQTCQCMLISLLQKLKRTSRLTSHRSQDVTQLATTIWYPKEPFIIMVVSIGWMNQNLCQREFSCGNHHFHLHPFYKKPTAFCEMAGYIKAPLRKKETRRNCDDSLRLAFLMSDCFRVRRMDRPFPTAACV